MSKYFLKKDIKNYIVANQGKQTLTNNPHWVSHSLKNQNEKYNYLIFSNIEIVYLVFLVVKYFVVESIVVESIGLLLVEGVGEEGAIEDGAAECELVGVLDLVAHADAARQDGDFYIGVWC